MEESIRNLFPVGIDSSGAMPLVCVCMYATVAVVCRGGQTRRNNNNNSRERYIEGKRGLACPTYLLEVPAS